MKRLIDKIKKEATVIDNRIIKVDHFINHMLDVDLVFDIGIEFSKIFHGVTKILTIETSGIAFAMGVSYHFGKIPIVFAKKKESAITGNNVYSSTVHSFTKDVTNNVIVDKEFLTSEDKVLIIDDFLAMGEALNGMVDLCNQAGASIVGAGIIIEKAYQQGRHFKQNKNIKVHSLAKIKEIKNNSIIFE